MTTLLLALAMAGALEVDGPPGCLDPVEIGNAIAEVGGIDVAETVAVRAVPILDEYTLVVDIALIRSAPLHREVPLRPRECADVADLVGVLVAGQRRAGLEARLRGDGDDGENSGENSGEGQSVASVTPAPQAGPPAPDRRLPQLDGERRLVTGWTPCDGPPDCGGFRLNVGLGVTLPLAVRLAADTGYDISPSLGVVALAEVMGSGGVSRAALSGGLDWRTRIDGLELSARAALGGGLGPPRAASAAIPAEAICDDGSTPKVPDALAEVNGTFFLAPSAAVRGRLGYLFVEAGTFFHLGIDDLPGGYLTVGLALLDDQR